MSDGVANKADAQRIGRTRSIPLEQRRLLGRFREVLASGGAEFDIIQGLDGQGTARVPRDDIVAETLRTLRPGEIYELFFENTTSSDVRICRFWSQEENPWLIGEVPKLGDEVRGRVVAFDSHDAAIVKLDEPGDPHSLTAMLFSEDLPREAKGRSARQALHLSDRVIGLVDSVRHDELYIRINCRAYLESQRRIDAQRNMHNLVMSSLTSTQSAEVQRPKRVTAPPLEGLRIIIFDNDDVLREVTCSWLKLLGADAEGASDLRQLRAAFKRKPATHVLVDYEGVKCAEGVAIARDNGASAALWSGSSEAGLRKAEELGVTYIAKPASLKQLELWARDAAASSADADQKPQRWASEAGLWTGRRAAGQVTRQGADFLGKLCERHDLAGALWIRREREGVFSIQAHAGVLAHEIKPVEQLLFRSAVTRDIVDPEETSPDRAEIVVGPVPQLDPVMTLLRENQRQLLHYLSMPLLESETQPRCVVFFATRPFDRALQDALAAEQDHAHHLLQLFRLTEHVDATEAFATVGRIYAATIHEMRNKVSQVIALADHLHASVEHLHAGVAQGKPPNLQKASAELHTKSSELQTTVTELKALAEADLRQIKKFRRDRLNIRQVIERTAQRMRQVKRTQFGYEGTHIEATCDPRLADREVCLSPITLEQPLINLIDNALHHVGDHDWGRVEVEARFVDSDAKTPIHIVVRDNGAGISAKGRDSMFEPRETSKGEKGVGMGLYASRNIVRAAGGTLECTEALMWACAEFKIRLPVLLGPSFDELTQ